MNRRKKQRRATPWHRLQVGVPYRLEIFGVKYFVKYISQDRKEIKVSNELLGTMKFNKSSDPRFYTRAE